MNDARATKAERKDRPQRTYGLDGHRMDAGKIAPGLHIVATPIGNLGDITLRALATLAAADVIACEDTRVTRKLLDRYAIAAPLTPYHDHNAQQRGPSFCARLAEGAAVALVSDAGTPLISDPGYKLVRAAQEAGHAVTALPGASSALAALTVAGLPTDQFLFAGFLPPKQAARRARIAELGPYPGDAHCVRNRAAARRDACRPRRRTRRTRSGRLPRAHQTARRGPARRAGDAGATKRRARNSRRVRSGHRSAAQPSNGERATMRMRSCGRARTHVAQGCRRRSRSCDRACRGATLYQRALALAEEKNREADDGAPR